MKLFVDTWGWLALEDRKDSRHSAAAECYKERSKAGGQVITSNFVLDETMTLLFQRRPFEEAWKFSNSLLRSPSISIASVNESRFHETFAWRRKFSDKPDISFTDLSSMVIMQELGIIDVLTADRHFGQVGLGFHILPD